MAGKSDGLRYALGRATLTGSKKTIHNSKRQASLFVDALRDMGFGVEKWTNVSNRHVAEVVDYWQNEELLTSTIKTYLSGVRAVCRAYGNDKIHTDNSQFGLPHRQYVTNVNKATGQGAYERVVSELSGSGDERQERLALMLEYQREFGMRFEESTKFNPLRDVSDGHVCIHVGTKGGRPRWIPIQSEEQQEVLDRAVQSGFYGSPKDSLIPPDAREEQWRGYCYRTAREHGLSKAEDGTMHGLRHAYAQERFTELTGFAPPVHFESKEAYEAQAEQAAGPTWRDKEELARCVVREELGHSPGRDDIDGQYLGKW